MRRFLRSAALQVALLALTVLCVEVLAYFLLPNSIAWRFYDYRRHQHMVADSTPNAVDYYLPNETRGHDIAPGRKKEVFRFLDSEHPIWSNKLGCFDQEWETVPVGYYYFAGDSFTWGYNRLEDNFPSLFERATGVPSLKCGVNGSGTRHQFEKFQEITKTIGHYPERVIVSYYSNDISDDFVHPHKTVIDGYLVEHIFLDENFKPVRTDPQWLHEKLQEALQTKQPQPSCSSDIKEWLRCHSLTANLYIALKVRWENGGDGGPIRAYLEYKGQRLTHLRTIESFHATSACHDCKAARFNEPNLKAIAYWKAHAQANNYKLAFMLIPPRYSHGQGDYYVGLSKRLTAMGIDVLDLSTEFYMAGVSASDVYWRYDGHFSPNGSRMAADALGRRWGR